MEPKKKKKKKEKSKKRTKEKNKGEKDEVEVQTRARSPTLESKNWKTDRDNRETKKLEHSSEVHRDRKRYRDEPVYKDRTKVDSYRKREYKEKDKKMGKGEDGQYKDQIEERIKRHKDNEERGKGRKDTERKRCEDKSRR